MRSARIGTLLGTLFGTAVVAGCSGGSDAPPTGTVSVSLMDRPVHNVTELVVTITEIWIKPAGSGPAFQLPLTTTPFSLDLLEHDDENAAVLVNEAVVEARAYNWIELVMDDSTIEKSYAMTTEGGMVPVDVPSDTIRLVSGFDVGPNQALRVLFDWDVHSGLAESVGTDELKLRPAFRILRADEHGAIEGTIFHTRIDQETSCEGLVEPSSGITVYVYEDDFELGETPQEIGASPAPLTTAMAEFNEVTGEYDYRVALMPGDYVLAATCFGELDADEPGDGITLFPAEGVQVGIESPQQLVELDFDFVE